MMKTLIVLPARNEEQQINSVLSGIRAFHPRLPVLVVNDASTDGTQEIVAKHYDVSLINLPFWMGYGGALQTAYKYALRNDYDAVIQLDADGQHDPRSIVDLMSRISEADVVVGSRFLGQKYRMPLFRRIGCLFLAWVAGTLTGMRITDPTSGYQALGKRALEIGAQDHYPLDYPDIDVLILMHRFRLKVVEIPVSMHPSQGKTGMHDGLQVWYYALKMVLSIVIMMLRKV